MIRTILAVIALACLIAPASAQHKTYVADPGCNIIFPCEGVTVSPRGNKIVKAMRGFGSPQKVYTPRAPQHARKHQHTIVPGVLTESRIAPPSLGYTVSRPIRFIAGHLICAINVGAALAERGIKGTGSALALSYLHWGRSAGGPVPGAVIVSARRGGGHVAIVSRVVNGVVMAWNATGGQSGWREIPYRHHVIDYRVPG